MDIYLVSDQADLENPLNGYFVRIGNTQDEISLYKQSGSKSSMQKIIDGTDKQIDLSLVELGIKVTKSQENTWELFVDYDLSGNYISEGSIMDSEHYFSNYFGIVCTYTSTRSDKFFFDDLSISGKNYSDDIKPVVDTLLVTSDSTSQIIFSEKITAYTAVDINNYLVDKNIEHPYSAIIENDTTVTLSFQNKFENKAEYLITISGIEDLFSNAMENTSISFTYKAPYLVGFNDILITEIMADPSPGVDLPEFEYLEIFNPGQESYTINNMKLVVGSDTATLPDFIIASGDYIILCQSAAIDHFTNFGRTLKVSNWPSLNNGGEPVALYNEKQNLVFFITYDDSWYKFIEKDDGGWSLEMIDTDFPCKGSENWKASTDPSGGTPGWKNSSADQLTDLSGPEITKIIAESSSSVIVYLNEEIGPKEITGKQITTNPELEVQEIQLDAPEYSMIRIDFNTSFTPKTQYELTITNLHDCIGNAQKETTSTFVLPEPLDSLDLIINEILYNPWPDGVDFVELYNQSDKYIDLQSMQFANDDDIKTITNDHFIIEPRQFLALTENPEILNNYYPGINPDNILNVADMPAFNDDEGSVALLSTDGKQMDFFQYSDGYHSAF